MKIKESKVKQAETTLSVLFVHLPLINNSNIYCLDVGWYNKIEVSVSKSKEFLM